MKMETLAKMMQDAFAKRIPGRWQLCPMDGNRADDWSMGFKLSNPRTGMVIHCKLWGNPEGKMSFYGDYPRDTGNYDIATNYTLKYPVPKKEMKVTEAGFGKVVQFITNQFYPAYEASYSEAMEIKEAQFQKRKVQIDTVEHLAEMMGGSVQDHERFERHDEKFSVNGRVDYDRVVLKLDVPALIASDLIKFLRDKLEPDESEKKFGEVYWCADDVRSKLEEHDIPATNENIDLVIDKCGKINDSMIEQGWLFIDIVIGDLESDNSFNMEGQEDGTVRESTEQVV